MRSVAVIGGGISGLVAALELSRAGVDVVLHEKKDYFVRDATTGNIGIDFNLSFLLFNPDPKITEFFESISIDVEEKELSFSLSLDEGIGYEWGTGNGLSSLFAQKVNALSPCFLKMIREISKFKDETLRYLEELEGNSGTDRNETLGHFVKTKGYSDLFQQAYLVPVCASVWTCSLETALSFSAYYVLSFFRNHHLLEPFGPFQAHVIRCGERSFALKVMEQLESKGYQIRSSCEVHHVTTDDGK